ncbi:ATP-binding protein [Chitinophaga solisilvae]|uniref:ATP-binding protein n=1 Tax=Chitinophaga solisilvae TaxID=1233460 RepID=UPI00136A0C3F|nr:ATP-binding protein [Chitinophaga solisilvae]
MEPVTVARLKNIPPLAEVPDEQLQWLIDHSEDRIVPDGENLFSMGQPVVAMIIILSGKVRVFRSQNGQYVEVMEMTDNNLTGYLPFSRIKTAIGNGVCMGDTRVLSCPKETINSVIGKYYELTAALVHVMSARIREVTSQEQQNEKMRALGKLSAGLAHELNNPVAAIVRSAATLNENIQNVPEVFRQMASLQLTTVQAELIVQKLHAIRESRPQQPLGLLELSDRETEILDWMEAKDIDHPETAEVLAECGLNTGDMETFSTGLPADELPVIFNWLQSALVADRMVNDIQVAAKRISGLVNAVKNFTYMDQASDKQMVDIHQGILNTLTMLDYKVRKGNIRIEKRFDDTLPRLKALPGELNQIWTNILDNAIDATEVNKKGNITIETTQDRQCIHISITDDGPGIPEEIRSRIFEPFFTTKEIGKGTGLGLDMVMQIVRRHNGSVKFTSEPGKTSFRISFHKEEPALTSPEK